MRLKSGYPTILVFAAALTTAGGAVSRAEAQFAGSPDGPAVGETYHVELSAGLWNPTPDLVVSSQIRGIAGTDIDVVDDLGVLKKRVGEFRVTVRPALKHKFRFHYIPLRYEASTTIDRDIVFNGQTYRVGLPVNSALDWKAYRFGYEYDFFYRDRGFIGLVAEAKYTDVAVQLDSVIGSEFVRARGPIPAIGGIGRGYVASHVSITGELTLFRLPEGIDDEYRGRYVDFDLYGTVNFSDHVGTQVGYRSIDVTYRIKNDAGDLKLNGLYFSGVVRF